MLAFTNISATGFTVGFPNGTTQVVSAAYNNETSDGFVYFDNLLEYRFDANYVTAIHYDSATHRQVVASSVWTIHHKLNGIPAVMVEAVLGVGYSFILPRSVQIVDTNTVLVTFSTPRAGRASIK